MSPSKKIPKPHLLRDPIDPTRLVSLYPEQWSFLLASAAGNQLACGRWSLLLRQSGKVFSKYRGDGRDFFAEVEKALSDNPRSSTSLDFDHGFLPFTGGLFVYLGYEMAASVEPSLSLPASTDQLPMAHVAHCPVAILHDHWKNEQWLVAETQALQEEALTEINAARTEPDWRQFMPMLESYQWDLSVDDPARFLEGVGKIQDYIRQGDVFQVNLSRAWRASTNQAVDPLLIHEALLRSNPSPFAGLARLPGGTLLSSSPERLVSQQGFVVETRPIAGTRPRGCSAQRDQDLIKELHAHPKERAEHIMLIDLERNDLGRVCRSGSIEVDELMVIETYEHVHHIVSNIKGELLPHASSIDVLKAVFPGGTITGCPKVRCMEIIAELEGTGRSFYTGAMGYIGWDRKMDFNILIRSMLADDSGLTFRTGAGIVVDSDPQAEVEETKFKALGLLHALGAGKTDVK